MPILVTQSDSSPSANLKKRSKKLQPSTNQNAEDKQPWDDFEAFSTRKMSWMLQNIADKVEKNEKRTLYLCSTLSKLTKRMDKDRSPCQTTRPKTKINAKGRNNNSKSKKTVESPLTSEDPSSPSDPSDDLEDFGDWNSFEISVDEDPYPQGTSGVIIQPNCSDNPKRVVNLKLATPVDGEELEDADSSDIPMIMNAGSLTGKGGIFCDDPVVKERVTSMKGRIAKEPLFPLKSMNILDELEEQLRKDPSYKENLTMPYDHLLILPGNDDPVELIYFLLGRFMSAELAANFAYSVTTEPPNRSFKKLHLCEVIKKIVLKYFSTIEENIFARRIGAWLADCKESKQIGRPRLLERPVFTLYEKKNLAEVWEGWGNKDQKEKLGFPSSPITSLELNEVEVKLKNDPEYEDELVNRYFFVHILPGNDDPIEMIYFLLGRFVSEELAVVFSYHGAITPFRSFNKLRLCNVIKKIALMYFPIEETTFAEHIDAWLSDCRAFKCTGKPRKLRRVTFSLFEKNIITSMIFGKEGKGTKVTTKKRPARK